MPCSFTPADQLLINGLRIWLLDVATTVPKSVQLHGFDISDGQHPAKEYLPDNVRLGVFDALADDIPEHLRGVYDVVHLRFFALIVRNNNVQPLIRNALRMLSMTLSYLCWTSDMYSTVLTMALQNREDICNGRKPTSKAWSKKAMRQKNCTLIPCE